MGVEVSYRWLFNGQFLDGATEALLTLPTVTPTNAGAYQILVSNASGSVTSAPAILTVVGQPPSILAPPQSTTNTLGETVRFSVLADSASPLPELSYQWLFGLQPLAGQTNSMLSFVASSLTNAGQYRALVGNAFASVTSAPATLSLVGPPDLWPGPLESNGFRLRLQGQAYRDFALESTTNLAGGAWSSFTTLTLTNPPQDILDPRATNLAPLFYRARVLP